MDYIKVTILLAAALSLTHAFHKLVPADKELIYKYRALVKAGTQIPVSFASQFVLEGFLHIQTGTNSTFVRLSDLKYHLYNGELNHVKEVEGVTPLPIPPEVADLLKVFKIIHDDSGKAIGISTETQEKMFSRNIKKAIASILQMDVDHMNLQVSIPHAYVTEEQSIYGKGSMYYNVVPHGDVINIHKMHEMTTTHHMYRYFLTNLEPLYCESPYEEPMSHDSQRKYKIVKHDDHHIVEHIEADGGIYMYPMRGQSEKYYLYVNQTMWLNEIVPIKDRYQVNAEHYENDLTYYLSDLSMEDGAGPDLTNGRRIVDVQKLTPIMQKMLDDIVEYMYADHIHMKTPDIKRGQLINRLRKLLSHFNLATLEQAYNTLVLKNSEHDIKVLDVFHHILPLVGTRAGAIHIKNLVVHNKVKEPVALHMLHSLPLNLKVANEKLLKEMEELIHLPSTISWTIHKTAVLCFGSVVHKIHEMEKHLHQQHHYADGNHAETHTNHDDDMVYHYDHHQHHKEQNIAESETPYEKYVIEFVAKVKSSNSFSDQMLYLEALFNMKLPSVAKHLEPAVKGEWWQCHHRRLLAMWAVSPAVMPNSDKVFAMYWPILTNVHEHNELRIMAYFIIMEAHPSISRLLNIFWFMHNEHDEELYNFHYSYWHSVSKTKDPCKARTKLNMNQLKNYMHKPVHGLSRYHQIDYHDYHVGVGGGFSGFWVNTNTTKLFTFSMNRHIFNVPTDNYAVYIRIDGLGNSLAKTLKLNTESKTQFFNYDELWSVIMNIPNNQSIHIEVVIMKHNQIINSYFIDGTNSKDLTSLLNFIHAPEYSIIKNAIHIDYEIFTKVYMPTDLGIPAVMEILIPTVHKYEINVTKETANKISTFHVDNHWDIWRHARFGVAFYNSIADVWQGINKYHSYDSVLPVHMDITVNPQQQSMKVSMKRHGDVHKDVIGLRSHVATMVFVKDDIHKNILTGSCKNCQEFTYVSRGEKYRHNYNIMHREDSNTGYNFHTVVYDSEIHVSNGSIGKIVEDLTSKYNKNYGTSLGRLILTLRECYSHILLRPRPGMNGLMMKMTPSTVNPVSQVDLSLRINRDINHEEYIFNPGMKISARATYVVKNDDKALKTWDVNAIVDFNPGHTLNNLKMQITRLIPGQKDFKICFEGVKKWSHEGVTGHMNVALGQSADGKCAKDDTVIDVTMTGTKSEEQKNSTHVYGDCVYPESYEVETHHPLSCLVAHTSVRDYIYNVKTTNVPSEFKKNFFHWLDVIRGHYLPYYTFIDEHDEEVGENNVKVKIHYPTAGDQFDVHVLTQHRGFLLNGIPTEDLPWSIVQPDNLHYSKLFMFMHAVGLTKQCHVHPNSIKTGYHTVPYHLLNEYTMFIGDAAQDAKHAIYIKNIDDKDLGVKVVHKEHIVEVISQGHVFHITVDGQKLGEDHTDHVTDWVHIKVYKGIEVHHSIVTLVLPYFGVHVEHDGDHIHIEAPQLSGNYFGHCISTIH